MRRDCDPHILERLIALNIEIANSIRPCPRAQHLTHALEGGELIAEDSRDLM